VKESGGWGNARRKRGEIRRESEGAGRAGQKRNRTTTRAIKKGESVRQTHAARQSTAKTWGSRWRTRGGGDQRGGGGGH